MLNIPAKVQSNINKLFKSTAYDIRAYVGEPNDFFNEKAILTPDAMRVAGSLMALIPFKREDGGVVQLKQGDNVVVGYDNGPTSKPLAKAFSEGLNDCGVNVYWIGVASSGQVYQNQEQLNAQGHCQITRSHVEVTSNGTKFGIGIQGIHTYLLGQMNAYATNGIECRDCKHGEIFNKTEEARDTYFRKMINTYGNYFSHRDNTKVGINVFGGTGLQYIELFQDIFGNEVLILGADVDVNAGDLLADPTRKEMLVRVPQLQDALNNDMRIHSFDLDADRGSVTQGKDALSLTGVGHYLGDNLAFILAEHKMKYALPELEIRLKALKLADDKIKAVLDIARIIYVDPRYTSSVKSYVDTILKGDTQFHRKGHSLWKETITSNMLAMAKLAGFNKISDFVCATDYRDIQIEASLHMFSTDVEDGIPRDDAVENIFILEQLIDKLNIKSLKVYFDNLPKRFITKEIRTTCISNDAKDVTTANVMDRLRSIFKSFSIVEFDGQIRIDWSTGFIMYGMSNTSPKLTFMAEGQTVEERNEALAFLMAIHNEERAKAGDTLPMDVAENPFYIEDKSYSMGKPDAINFDEKRVKSFINKHKLVVISMTA